MFHEVAIAWRSSDPSSGVAREALAIALEMLGDPSALDTLALARSLALEPRERLRLAASEVWMRLKFALPLDVAGLRRARALADSILAHPVTDPGPEAILLASLASLTGRADQAANFARQATAEWRPPGPIAHAAPALLAYAALGGPRDSLRALFERVEAGIKRLGAPEQLSARNEWLGRPSTLVFPHYPEAIELVHVEGDYLFDAETAFARGDTARMLQILLGVQQGLRAAGDPSTVTFDALFPEAWLLAAAGRPREAANWIDPTFNALAETPPRVFADPARAGAVVQAMGLRAILADQLHDQAGAARWARIVTILWSDADPFLQPFRRRMAGLAR
jgi:hypothetical protein